MDSFFLNSQHMLDALATLVMLQVLQAGNAVHASLLGVFQGSYSGAQHADGILKFSEIGFIVITIFSACRSLVPRFSLTTRFVDDSAFCMNPYAVWMLHSVYPIKGLKFTIETVEIGGEVCEYMGLHISLVPTDPGWCSVVTAYYDKKRDVPRKYGLPFELKAPFIAASRPILSSNGIISGDVHRLCQACSTPAALAAAFRCRFDHWHRDCKIPYRHLMGKIADRLCTQIGGLRTRYGWCAEAASVAAAVHCMQDLFLNMHSIVMSDATHVGDAVIAFVQVTDAIDIHLQYSRNRAPVAPDFVLGSGSRRSSVARVESPFN